MILNIIFLLNLLQLKLFTLNNSETNKISLKYIILQNLEYLKQQITSREI